MPKIPLCVSFFVECIKGIFMSIYHTSIYKMTALHLLDIDSIKCITLFLGIVRHSCCNIWRSWWMVWGSDGGCRWRTRVSSWSIGVQWDSNPAIWKALWPHWCCSAQNIIILQIKRKQISIYMNTITQQSTLK
jgi:hypothetical protein